MRFVLIRPPVLMPAFNMADLVVPPIGPAYIAAVLRKMGHQVTLIDAVGLAIEQYTRHEHDTMLHGLKLNEVVERIPSDADGIGISIEFSYEWPVGRELVKLIRQRFPKVLLIAGGEHVTAAPELCLNDSPLDILVAGEGENTICEILRIYESGGKDALTTIPGIWYRDTNGHPQRTTAVTRIKEIDAIPWPAWDLIPMEEYLSRGLGFGVDRGRSIPVLASRGCPYQCTFCSNPAMWTPRWKPRDPNDLLDEIAFLQKTYNATNFDFFDLTLIVKKEWIIDFCKAIESRKMNFTWQLPSGTRSEAIDQEVTQWLYRTGCRNVSYAPESGSVETLTLIKKRVSLPRLMQSMRQAVKDGLNVKCNFIFGFPHERWKNIFESFWAIVKCAWIGIHDISIWVFVPYPGCELFTQLQERGDIKQLDDQFFYNLAAYADITKTYSYCQNLSTRELIFSRTLGLAMFYSLSWLFRPWRPFNMMYHAVAGHLESRSELALRGFLKRCYKWVSQG